MTDIPIIFSAPMVRALIDGRKTMTRRILKPQPTPFLVDEKECDVGLIHTEIDARRRVTLGRVVTKQEILYGVGDRLWVRERAWFDKGSITGLPLRCFFEGGHVRMADGRTGASPGDARSHTAEIFALNSSLKLRPSIHMPRWASRLTLIVKSVKIERLQEISEQDAISEGIHRIGHDMPLAAESFKDGPNFYSIDIGGGSLNQPTAAGTFSLLWKCLYGDSAWDANPFVVAISFRVIKANINAPEARIAT